MSIKITRSEAERDLEIILSLSDEHRIRPQISKIDLLNARVQIAILGKLEDLDMANS